MPDDKEVEKLGTIDPKAFGAAVDKLKGDIDKVRVVNTAVGAVSGMMTGNPLAAVTQAVAAYQQPVSLDQVKAMQNLPPPPPGTGKGR